MKIGISYIKLNGYEKKKCLITIVDILAMIPFIIEEEKRKKNLREKNKLLALLAENCVIRYESSKTYKNPLVLFC